MVGWPRTFLLYGHLATKHFFAEATVIMLVGRQLGLKGGSVGLRCLSVAAGEASEALGHVEASEGRLDRNRVSRRENILNSCHTSFLRMALRD